MYQLLDDVKLVPVLRKIPYDVVYELIETLVKAGIQAIEVTMDSECATEIIAESKRKFGERLIVGAGTVLSVEDCEAAIKAGAEFVVSPSYNESVLKFSLNKNVPMIPGVFTPTEMQTAYAMGAKMVKIFPANVLGPGFIKNVKGPLSHIRLMATGGIHIQNARLFLDAGVDVVGAGSELVNKEDLKNRHFHQIEQDIQKWFEEINR